ncbi:hypothetical protein Cgig2_015622 [Carnegiea gigantea]|uniref:Uncharacterized protein n=1 Tax=Carnegiea gigantea TaxID=171969 RepID=A0A9Q1JNJ6_9CARY|nr:hypothetical protein Cgig2_015622 [Carnegiea gigantea]
MRRALPALRGKPRCEGCNSASNLDRHGSSADIITWDCLKRLKHSGREITPLVHPILGFRGQEFGHRSKARNLEVDFLVVDVPTAYNVILGRLTLHKVKAIIASVGKFLGDQQTTRKCYLVNIRPLAECSDDRELVWQQPSHKMPCIAPPTVAEALPSIPSLR